MSTVSWKNAVKCLLTEDPDVMSVQDKQDALEQDMNKKAFLATLATLLAWMGVLAIVTGIIKDEKSLYALAAVCMILFSILILLASRPHIRLGPK